MKILQKTCLVCKTLFQKPYTESLHNWETRRKYCSKTCADKAPRSVDTREKMRVKKVGKPSWNKGKPWPARVKLKMSIARQGITLSPETRRRMSVYRKGRKLPIEWRKRMSLGQRGVKGSNWQGGKTEITESYRKHVEYKLWREEVFKRDNYTCQLCGLRGGKLNADHIKSFALHKELRYDVNNGRTLCGKCHLKTDTYGGRSRVTKSGSKNTNAA